MTLGGGAHPRILIADDEPHNRSLLEIMLTPEPFVIAMAGSGEEALALHGEVIERGRIYCGA